MDEEHHNWAYKASPSPDLIGRHFSSKNGATLYETGDDENFELEHEAPDCTLRRDRPHTLEKHQSRSFTYLDAGFILKGVATYIFDVVTDILACIRYFATGDFWWAILTMVFILLASITVQAASFRWFVDDYTQKRTRKPVQGFCKKALDWLVWIVVHVLQLGTVNRYLRCLYFGWKSRKSFEKYYIWKVYEQRDLTMLRLIEAFLEAGPQLVLQIYIMLQLYLMSELPQFYWITALSALSSLLSLSWALEAYHKALRESLEEKNDISYCGVGFRLVWRVSMITSRVTAMALFALHFEYIIFPVVFFHWVLMTVWLISQKTDFCETKTEERLFCCVIAVVHIFCFFNMKEGRTRFRITLYYILIFFENSAMAGLWYYFSGIYIHDNYGFIALSFVCAGYLFGILAMIIYYSCFHPNRSQKVDSTLSSDAFRQGTDEVDCAFSQDVPDGFGKRRRASDKHCGNMFSKSGRRYLYWLEGNDTSQEKMPPQNLSQLGDLDENGNAIDVRIAVEEVRNSVNNIIDQQHCFSVQNYSTSHETSV